MKVVKFHYEKYHRRYKVTHLCPWLAGGTNFYKYFQSKVRLYHQEF